MENTTRLRALVVDDDDTFRNLTTRLLGRHCDVRSARSGNEAIAYLREHEIDVVFSDVVMEDGTGIQLLDWITGAQLAHTPVVVLVTGQSTVSNAEALAKGAFEVVAKPFRLQALMQLLKRAGDLIHERR